MAQHQILIQRHDHAYSGRGRHLLPNTLRPDLSVHFLHVSEIHTDDHTASNKQTKLCQLKAREPSLGD